MKKIFILILLLMLVIFLIPVLFTKNFSLKEIFSQQPEEKKNTVVENNYDYKSYTTIKLFHAKTEQVEEVKLDDYLYSVVSAEMPADFQEEALKAQAVVARTYTIYKIVTNQNKHGEADICDSAACCQAWISKEDRLAKWEEALRQSNWDKIVNCVNSTQGKLITYEGKPINAFFHSNSGGATEVPINVWGGSGYPYLQSVQTSGEDSYSQYLSEAEFSKEEFIQKIKEKHNDFQIDFADTNCIQVKEKTDGNRIKTLKVGNLELAGVEIRTLLGLRSANFEVSIEENTIKFNVYGYGHGVGMSQTGADSLAKQGQNYEQIIHHFYTGVEIVDM